MLEILQKLPLDSLFTTTLDTWCSCPHFPSFPSSLCPSLPPVLPSLSYFSRPNAFTHVHISRHFLRVHLLVCMKVSVSQFIPPRFAARLPMHGRPQHPSTCQHWGESKQIPCDGTSLDCLLRSGIASHCDVRVTSPRKATMACTTHR